MTYINYLLKGAALFAAYQNLETIFYYGSKKLGNAVLEGAKGFTENIPSTNSFGKKAGQDFNTNFNEFFDNLNLSKLTGRVGSEFNNGFESGLKEANFKKGLETAAKEIGDGLKVIRENGVKEVDLFRSDIQGIFANMAEIRP